MKKKLMTALITSLIMIAVGGGLLWKFNSMSKQVSEESEALRKEERDLVEEQREKAIDNISTLDIQQLNISGDRKNVITISYGTSQIYNTVQSAKAEKNLTDIRERRDYSFENPLWAYNPYGTNPLGMYVYFKTSGNAYCRYTISVKDSKIPDFTRTLDNGEFGTISKEHEGQIIGLVPGKTNYIILKLYNKDDALSQMMTFEVQVPKSPSGAKTFLSHTDGRSKSSLSNGLYMVFGDSIKGKKQVARQPILLYDNSGVLRAEFPSEGYIGNSAAFVYDTIVYTVASNKIVQVNALGQVVKTFQINGYRQSGEFTYDDSGNIYLIATELGKNKTKNSRILKLELESGKVSVALNMEEVLPEVYAKARKQSKKASKDWIDVNSVQVAGINQLLVSSGKLSSIFKISNAGSLMPKVDYIIADKKLWKDYKKYRKRVLEKALPEGTEATEAPTPIVDSILDTEKKETPDVFASQYGQNAMQISKGGLGEGQYYLSMLNNNSGSGATNSQRSYYYRFQVDEGAGTYILKDRKGFEKNNTGGNMVKEDGRYLYCQSGKNCFSEIDTAGKLLRSYTFDGDLYRVYKSEWKDFWFH